MVGRRKGVCDGEEEGVYGGEEEERSVWWGGGKECGGREKGELKHECVEERTLVHSVVNALCHNLHVKSCQSTARDQYSPAHHLTETLSLPPTVPSCELK